MNWPLLLIAIAIAISFGYNLTESMEKEDRLLQACIAFNLELPACDQIYGSIPK